MKSLNSRRAVAGFSRLNVPACLMAVLLVSAFLWAPSLVQAQTGGAAVQSKLPALTGPQKRTLMLIAREALTATLENRPSREATVEPRLMQPQPMVVSIYVDGRLRARAWRLTELTPIYLAARDLTYLALSTPRVSKNPLTLEELHRAQISLAVLSNYTLVTRENEIPNRSAIVLYHGFTEWLTLPDDLPSDDPVQRLEYTCVQAGLRPKVWLLPQTTIYTADVEGTTHSPF